MDNLIWVFIIGLPGFMVGLIVGYLAKNKTKKTKKITADKIRGGWQLRQFVEENAGKHFLLTFYVDNEKKLISHAIRGVIGQRKMIEVFVVKADEDPRSYMKRSHPVKMHYSMIPVSLFLELTLNMGKSRVRSMIANVIYLVQSDSNINVHTIMTTREKLENILALKESFALLEN
jgi:hypothetical protein